MADVGVSSSGSWNYPVIVALGVDQAMTQYWTNHLTYKRWHFAAVAQYRKSLEDLSANR